MASWFVIENGTRVINYDQIISIKAESPTSCIVMTADGNAHLVMEPFDNFISDLKPKSYLDAYGAETAVSTPPTSIPAPV